MPMDFPDMKSLKQAAEVHEFRVPEEGEAEEVYREALADHVADRDFVESEEKRNGVGWDKFSREQNLRMLRRSGMKNSD